MTAGDIQIIKQIIREEISGLVGIDKYTFQKNLQIFDGKNIKTGITNGTMIGMGIDQKVGFFTEADVQFPYSRGNNQGYPGGYVDGAGDAVKVDTVFGGTDALGADQTPSVTINGYTIGDIVTALKFYGLLAKDS